MEPENKERLDLKKYREYFSFLNTMNPFLSTPEFAWFFMRNGTKNVSTYVREVKADLRSCPCKPLLTISNEWIHGYQNKRQNNLTMKQTSFKINGGTICYFTTVLQCFSLFCWKYGKSNLTRIITQTEQTLVDFPRPGWNYISLWSTGDNPRFSF